MNAIQMTEELRENYVKYLMTTFDLSVMDQSLAEALRQKLIAPGVLFQGPYLELNPPYETGSSLRDLVSEGVLDERLCRIREDIARPEERPLPPDRPLYLHQEQAIRRVVTGNRNLVVASGTGSGKTESFLIPIINDLIRDDRPGVRAILIYPMNALVNDQLERLRRLLRGTRITFGRYTSELKMTELDGRNASPDAPANEVVSRERIRGDAKRGQLPDPPQILITNYAMLEHLLIRPEDSPVFETSHLKFICLDEAHTYSGAQGIEVSMLLRRLKHRLGIQSKDLQCIATSATLTPDDREAAASFASKLFGEKFEEEDVIFGTVDKRELEAQDLGKPVRLAAWRGVSDGLIERLREGAAATSLDQGAIDEILTEFETLGLISAAQAAEVRDGKEERTLPAHLWQLFRFSPEIAALRSRLRQGPLDLRQAAAVVIGEAESDEGPDEAEEDDDWKAEAVCRIVEIGAMARETETSTALLPARYHLFARSPQGAWICLNPECPPASAREGRRGWSEIFLEKGESCPRCRHALYELIACRSCGQPFIKAFERNGQLFTEGQMIGEAAGVKTRFFTWSPLNEVIEGDDHDEDAEGSGEEHSAEVNRTSICLKCRHFRDHCGCNRDRCAVDLYRIDSKIGPVERLTVCPRCQKGSGRGGSEVATSITVNNRAPLAVLAENLYRSSPKNPGADAAGMPGEGRKLLAFTDSRQGAARFASYLQESSDDIFARHLIYRATLELNEDGTPPDIEAVATKALELEHSYKPPQDYIGSSKIARLKDERVKSILADFCTTLDTRYSLLAIGLVDCLVDIRQSEMPSDELASAFGLDQAALLVAMQVLLDRLRYKGSVTLPPGIRKDDPFFKPASIGKPCQRTKSQTEKKGREYDIWIHPDDRNAIRQTQFDYVRRLLAATGRDSGNAAVRHALGLFWDWATSKRILNNNQGPGNYLIDHRRLNFSTTSTWYQCHKCRRRSTRRLSELIAICPSRGCTGELRPIDASVENQEDQDDNYYRSIFRRSPIAMRVEEHTAQLKPEVGRKYQDDFIRGKVNILSCSTTFEMGVDVGDLQTILLSNVPPRVANYRQRAGRAGRRAGGTAFILTYASTRPHDQFYYSDPVAIISGEVAVPYLGIDNEIIAERHRNAILLAHFLRWLKAEGQQDLESCAAFFDPDHVGGRHISRIAEWRENSAAQLEGVLAQFAAANPGIPHGSPAGSLQSFIHRLDRRRADFERWLEQYKELRDKFTSISDSGSSDSNDAETMRRRYRGFIDLLQEEKIINFLCREGVLPSYSFPIDQISLRLPSGTDNDPSRRLRLDRDKRIAITEYAPGAEVVADKRVWKSVGLDLRGQLNRYAYRICGVCNNLITAERGGLPTAPCQVCGNSSSGGDLEYIDPDGFTTDLTKDGEKAGKSIERSPNRARSFLLSTNQDGNFDQLPTSGPKVIEFSHRRNGELVTINTGSDPDGFRICESCGMKVKPVNPSRKSSKKESGHRTAQGGNLCYAVSGQYGLGHKFRSDTLHLRFHDFEGVTVPAASDISFWRSLTYALLEGASLALQIERLDLDGLVSPFTTGSADGSEENFSQEIVLFDDVPGGAGHVSQIMQKMRAVLMEARRVAECPDCEEDTSCQSCLRNYNNQIFWGELKRGKVARFLESVINATFPEDLDHLAPGAARKVAADLPRWLSRELLAAEQKVILLADEMTLEPLPGSRQNWFDIIREMLLRKVDVHLLLGSLPQMDRRKIEDLRILHNLQHLVQYGLQLSRIEGAGIPDWNILIDPQGTKARAVMVEGQRKVFNANVGAAGMITTINPEGVSEVWQRLRVIPNRRIEESDLQLPPQVRVLEISDGERKTERDLFGHLFRSPLKEMTINDPYLCSNHHETRIAAYLEQVKVDLDRAPKIVIKTRDVEKNTHSGNQYHYKRRLEQQQMFARLQRQFPGLQIEYRLLPSTDHDRSVVLKRLDGEGCRIVIGKGLDFIKYKGGTAKTFIIIEDPYVEAKI